ncbi:MAG: hypothetical protein HYV07_12180 [Deltaproteobacteria bacterium]|nr:hypothetical protein [Deltaproteobacteria bacterium]
MGDAQANVRRLTILFSRSKDDSETWVSNDDLHWLPALKHFDLVPSTYAPDPSLSPKPVFTMKNLVSGAIGGILVLVGLFLLLILLNSLLKSS